MKRFVYLILTLAALSFGTASAESPAEPRNVTGTVKVETGLTGSVEAVQIVEPSGETTTVEGPVTDVLSTLNGRKVELQGVVVTTAEGKRLMTASAYKLL